jgi:hypothetical protein
MSVSTSFTGKITKVGEVEVISDRFKKKELWLEIDQDSEWPQEVPVEFVNDNIDRCVVSKYKVGDEVEIDVNIRGNANKDRTRCFTKLQGWRLRGLSSAPGEPQTENSPPPDSDDPPF